VNTTPPLRAPSHLAHQHLRGSKESSRPEPCRLAVIASVAATSTNPKSQAGRERQQRISHKFFGTKTITCLFMYGEPKPTAGHGKSQVEKLSTIPRPKAAQKRSESSVSNAAAWAVAELRHQTNRSPPPPSTFIQRHQSSMIHLAACRALVPKLGSPTFRQSASRAAWDTVQSPSSRAYFVRKPDRTSRIRQNSNLPPSRNGQSLGQLQPVPCGSRPYFG